MDRMKYALDLSHVQILQSKAIQHPGKGKTAPRMGILMQKAHSCEQYQTVTDFLLCAFVQHLLRRGRLQASIAHSLSAEVTKHSWQHSWHTQCATKVSSGLDWLPVLEGSHGKA